MYFLCYFFNKILDTGHLPEEWFIGVIVPSYKNKGDIKDPHNYRGITLLRCLSKLFTSISNERLTEFSDKCNIVQETQAGFRQGYSTLDHIFLLKKIVDFLLIIGKLLMQYGGMDCGIRW